MATVTAIVPVYDGEAFLADALGSIRAGTRAPDEIVVVDDGSRDGSAALAERTPGVRCVRQEHAGIAAARNRGLAEARGDLIAFLDADDLWTPDKLALQAGLLERRDDLDMVFGGVVPFRDPARPSPAQPARLPGSGVIRRRTFDRVGPFETAWTVGEFVSWYARAMELGARAEMLPDVVLRRRIHGANTGIRERASVRDYARIVKAALDRRRAGGSA
jgi:glycosyltransferase involved in cell wall biosynthesis